MSPSSSTPPLNPRERAILKLVLQGQSVIDWSRSFFSTEEEIARLLKVNEFDLSREKDTERLRDIHNEAVGYLRGQLHFDLPPELCDDRNLVPNFLAAADPQRSGLQKKACGILKTMNIINHIDGRELLHNCPISVRDLFSLVDDKIERTLSALSRRESIPLQYEGGRKPKESLVTKLLSKRDTIAAQIYDRVRYRIVTRTKEDVVKVLLHLFDTILPFNYVIPNASVNQLIRLDRHDRFSSLLRTGRRLFSPSSPTEYSGRNYRVCKFVADIPLRMDNFLAAAGNSIYRDTLGSIAYVLVEFQILDEETAFLNDTGSARHENYKRRQKRGVVRRLLRD